MIPVALVVAGIIYYRFNPSDCQFAPKCPLWLLTGWQCPSCGIQRAFHAFLHGDVMGGMRYNYFLVIALPYAFAAVLATWYDVGDRFAKLRRFVYSGTTLRVYLFLFVAWWIVRNILKV